MRYNDQTVRNREADREALSRRKLAIGERDRERESGGSMVEQTGAR